MATIKLAILKHTQAKDGSYKIRIAIGHKQETHYIITRYRVLQWGNFKNGVVCNQPDANYVNVKLRQILNDYDTRLDSIPNLSDLSCGQLRDMLRDMRPVTSSATIQGVANEYIALLRKENRSSYAEILSKMVRKFLAYTNGDIYLQNISTATIDGYSHYLRSQGAAPAYETMCIANIRTLVNRAIKLQLVRYDVHPFLYWHATQAEPRELDIPVEEFRKFLTYQTKFKSKQRAVDFFILSYYLGGINLKDLIEIDFRDYQQHSVLRYIRRKTRIKKRSNQYIEFTIQPEAYPLINKYLNPKTGHIADIPESKYRSFLNYIDLSLRDVASKLGVGYQVSFYTARKSFVQHGFELGISLETLEYCIGQSMKANRPIFNYVKIMRQHADKAIRLILDNLLMA